MLADDGTIVGQGPIVVCSPDDWLGKRLPLMDHIDVGDLLGQGEWVVLIVRRDCPQCQDKIRQYDARAIELAYMQNARVAVIEIPTEDGPALAQNCLNGRLATRWNWRLPIPLELRLSEGITVSIDT